MHSNRPSLHVLLGVIGAILFTEYAMDVVWNARYYGWGDFRAFYTAAAVSERGGDIYDLEDLNKTWLDIGDQDVSARIHHVFPYPPLLAVLLRPFTGLSIIVATRVWLATNALLWLGCLFALLSYLNLRPRDLAYWALLFIGLRFEPALSTLKCGQVNILLFLLVLISLHALKRDRSSIAGLFLASAITLKLTPLVLLAYYVLRRRYGVALWTGAFLVILFIASCAISGFAPHAKYVREVVPSLSAGFMQPENQSLMAWFLRLFAACGWHDKLALSRRMATLAGLTLVLITFRDLLRRPRSPEGYSVAELSLCIVLVSIVSPVTWSHHLVWAILPLACMITHIAWKPVSSFTLGSLLISYALLGVVDDYYVHPIFQKGYLVFFSSIKLYSLLWIYYFLLKADLMAPNPAVPEKAMIDGIA